MEQTYIVNFLYSKGNFNPNHISRQGIKINMAVCRRALKLLERRIRLYWVPDYSGIVKRWKANDLARSGSLMVTSHIDSTVYPSLSINYLLSLIDLSLKFPFIKVLTRNCYQDKHNFTANVPREVVLRYLK